MCKAMEDMVNEAAILSAIDTARKFGGTDQKILEYIMSVFKLSEAQANEILTQHSVNKLS